MHLCRSSSNVPRLPLFLEMLQNPQVLLTFDKVHNPFCLPCRTTSQLPKVVRSWCVLYIMTLKCASRRNGVHFSTSQLPKAVRDRQFLTLFTSLCVYLCIFSSVKFFLHLSFDLPLDLSINLSSRHVDNKTMLLDFCWQHQKRSNSARLSHFLQLKTSKNFLQKWKVDCTPDVLRFFHAMSLKYCACHKKVSPGYTKCCTCHEIASWHS